MWLPAGKAPLDARRTWRKAASDARAKWGVGRGLGASGLKYDAATGMWLPPPREGVSSTTP